MPHMQVSTDRNHARDNCHSVGSLGLRANLKSLLTAGVKVDKKYNEGQI